MSTYILFEPENLSPFGPLTLLRSVSEIRFGVFSNLERAQRILPEDSIEMWVRPILVQDHEEKYPDININKDAEQNSVFLNAATPAWMYPAAIAALEHENDVAVSMDGRIVAAKMARPLPFTKNFHKQFLGLKTVECDTEICDFQPNWIWDYLNLIGPALEFDAELWKADNNLLTKLPPDLSTLTERNIHIHNTAQIGKFVHLDASQGPILIGEDVKISPFCSLVGPLFIGRRSTLKPNTSIRHTIVGKVCNLGGEIKGCIIHPYSNKSHDGFLGDSIVGSWVNMGAGSTTSNMKNNYQNIRVSWDGNNYETGRQFLGTIIGDHCKTAVGVRLNTGTMIGPFSNIFQADFPPRAIPSFSWGNGTHELEKAIATARLMMKRRNLELSAEQKDLMHALAEDNTPFIQF